MSQLKKQSIAGRKNSRRSKHSQTAQKASRGGGALSVVVSSCRTAARMLGAVGKPCLNAAKKWPRVTIAVSLGCGALLAAGYGINLAMSSITQSLPRSVEINSPRQALHETISRMTNDTLNSARQEEWSRSALTDKLLSRLSLVDGVDEVSIRSGLDKKLIIDVAAQAPVLVVVGKGSERILVGNKFKIIARNLNINEYSNLPLIEAPELNLQTQTPRERRKTHRGLFVKPASTSDSAIRWISQQALKIVSLHKSGKISSDLEKIVWRSSGGFSAVLRHQDDSAGQKTTAQPAAVALPAGSGTNTAETLTAGAPKRTFVILGEGKFEEKFGRLEQVLQDMRLKQKLIEQIDLAFSDKAIIRMSENLSEVKRGGVQ
ncbi:MAG: cell division protein FtsQ [Proteobacteria bacterium]|nr:cell division protein FtsQ [Pseudomonadota bacterium]